MTGDSEGARLLDELRQALTNYVVLPSSTVADAVTLWIAATHALPAFEHAPRLAITSPEKRCGKSRLLDILEATCHDPLVTVNASAPAVFRSLDAGHPPTLLVDEADAIFGKRRNGDDKAEDLRGLLNAGHQRGRPAIRCVGPQQTPQRFPTFAMVAIAAIGELPDTITDRAVNVRMRRRAPGEEVSPYRSRRDAPALFDLRTRLSTWANGNMATLRDAAPSMPVEDRAADTWEPLVAVADVAGGAWGGAARRAALELTQEADSADGEANLARRLLADCREVLTEAELTSAELVDRLRRLEDAPWEGVGLDQVALANRLRSYGVKPRRMRVGLDGRQRRGYRREDFADAFSRYLPDDARGASQAVTPSQAQVGAVTGLPAVTGPGVTAARGVTGLTWADDAETACDGIPGGLESGLCAICSGLMIVLEPGQTAHPTCAVSA